ESLGSAVRRSPFPPTCRSCILRPGAKMQGRFVWSTLRKGTPLSSRCDRQAKFGQSMNKTILEMRGITKTFPGVKALQDVNLDVVEGEIHAIVGENGAGKSTLMKILSGVYPHGSYEGQVVFEGHECHF